MLNFAEPTKTLPVDGDVRSWLESQMKEHALTTLLAFADDGVIWGHWDGSKLTTSNDLEVSYPKLKPKTLQQAFAFNDELEVRLFHDELGNWKAWQIKDDGEVMAERQILWGDTLDDKKQPEGDLFKRLLAERKGIPPQLIPVKGIIDENTCVRLVIHHLVDYTEAGESHVAISRLAGITIGKKAEEV